MSTELKFPEITAQDIANMAMNSLSQLSNNQQELLFQTKKEQTFSAILASNMQDNLDSSQFRALVELKGVDYLVKATSNSPEKKNRNTHDLGVLDAEANLGLILENKVWYHFDGAKGARTIRVEKNVQEQLKDDIFKLKHTAKNQKIEKCFVLLNLVTPSDPKTLPKSYRESHDTVLKRTNGDIAQYRKDGLQGVKSVIDAHSSEFRSVVHIGSKVSMGVNESGFLDIFCAQVNV